MNKTSRHSLCWWNFRIVLETRLRAVSCGVLGNLVSVPKFTALSPLNCLHSHCFSSGMYRVSGLKKNLPCKILFRLLWSQRVTFHKQTLIYDRRLESFFFLTDITQIIIPTYLFCRWFWWWPQWWTFQGSVGFMKKLYNYYQKNLN